MQGRIDVEVLKERFENDIINNMKLAERMGVLNVIRDMKNDAEEKM